jgi:N-acetylmuramoyl-L-alanine amidase
MKHAENAKDSKVAKTATIAQRIGLCGLCVFGGLCAPRNAHAAPPVRTMYTQALAREQTVRTALTAPGSTAAVLVDVHAVVAAYEAVVRHYPGSGYSDNALWQAGRLSLDAFARFGQPADRDAGVRLLRKLTTSYPTSKLASQVSEQLSRVNAADADAARPKGRALQTSNDAAPAPPPFKGVDAKPAYVGTGLQKPAYVGTGLQAGPKNTAGPATTAASSSKIAMIKDIRRAVLPDAVRITIELDGEVPFHEERIPDPDRVFVDLPGTRAAAPLLDQTIRFTSDADIVRQVRIGRHPNSTTRVVLDAAGVTSYSVYPLYSPYRLVIDCVRSQAALATMNPARLPVTAAAAPVAAPAVPPAPAPLKAHALTKDWLRHAPAMSPRAAALIAGAHVVVAEPAPPLPKIADIATAAPLPGAAAVAPAARNASGGLSIARQLGLGVSRIVIDPGHGGHDSGAKGRGVTEAELVLDVSLRLEKLLLKVPGVEVLLTRRTDEFIPLPDRTAIANRESADLFLSVHANASANPQAHGVETYFLNFANNSSAAAVAARENAASTLAMGEMPDLVKTIALNNKVDESRDFATHVQHAMAERLRTSNKTLKDLGVKQAPFVVLIGATMPSVLAEISFVTNPQEAKLLKSSVYRQRIAESLFTAIRKYQTSLKAAPTVALQ